MSGSARPEALARLDVFVGDWEVEALFPGVPARGPTGSGSAAGSAPLGHSTFAWILEGSFLMQRTEVPVPDAPDSLAIVSVDPDTGGYTQHYYDSRGVARLYAMSLTDGVWQLLRDRADFTPLSFQQRYTGTFGSDQDTIHGAWQKSVNGASWEHDFTLTYRRVR